jgi:hypothetical protein
MVTKQKWNLKREYTLIMILESPGTTITVERSDISGGNTYYVITTDDKVQSPVGREAMDLEEITITVIAEAVKAGLFVSEHLSKICAKVKPHQRVN